MGLSGGLLQSLADAVGNLLTPFIFDFAEGVAIEDAPYLPVIDTPVAKVLHVEKSELEGDGGDGLCAADGEFGVVQCLSHSSCAILYLAEVVPEAYGLVTPFTVKVQIDDINLCCIDFSYALCDVLGYNFLDGHDGFADK